MQPIQNKRLSILALAATVVALNVILWDGDPWSLIPLALADLFLFGLLLSGWRRLAREEQDAREIATLRQSQRKHARELPRE